MQRHSISMAITIFAAFAITQLSSSAFLPAMPTLVHSLQTDQRHIMSSLGIFFTGYAIGQLVWGSASDHFGRKQALGLSLIVCCIANIAICFSSNILAFSSAFALLGFAVAAYTSVGNALIKDIYDKKNAVQMVAYVGIVMASGSIIGPTIGGHLLAWFNWQAIFYFLAIYAGILLIGVLFFIPKKSALASTATNVDSLRQAYKKILTNRDYLANIIVLGATFGCLYTFLDVAPFIYHHYLHASGKQIGWLIAVGSISFIIGALIVARGIKHFSTKSLVISGLVITVLGLCIFLMVAIIGKYNILTLILPVFVFTLGLGICVPSTKAGAMSLIDENVGTAASAMKFTQILITIIMINLAAYFHLVRTLPLFAVLLLAFVVVACGLFYFLQSKTLEENKC